MLKIGEALLVFLDDLKLSGLDGPVDEEGFEFDVISTELSLDLFDAPPDTGLPPISRMAIQQTDQRVEIFDIAQKGLVELFIVLTHLDDVCHGNLVPGIEALTPFLIALLLVARGAAAADTAELIVVELAVEPNRTARARRRLG